MDAAGVTVDELTDAARRPTAWLVSASHARFTFVQWISVDRIILVDATVQATVQRGEEVLIDELSPVVVLALRPDLPAGKITRDHDVEELLAFVADSFGVPIRCHPDEPAATLYSGPWDSSRPIERLNLTEGYGYAKCGAFEPEANWAWNVYSIDIVRYLAWLRQSPESD